MISIGVYGWKLFDLWAVLSSHLFSWHLHMNIKCIGPWWTLIFNISCYWVMWSCCLVAASECVWRTLAKYNVLRRCTCFLEYSQKNLQCAVACLNYINVNVHVFFFYCDRLSSILLIFNKFIRWALSPRLRVCIEVTPYMTPFIVLSFNRVSKIQFWSNIHPVS